MMPTPTPPTNTTHKYLPVHRNTQHAHNVHTIPHLQTCVHYMHQAFFCPPVPTLLCATNLGFLTNIPFMSPDLIHKYLAKSPVTAKGHLKIRPSGYQSTCHTSQPCPPSTAQVSFGMLPLLSNTLGHFTPTTLVPYHTGPSMDNISSLLPTPLTPTTSLWSPPSPHPTMIFSWHFNRFTKSLPKRDTLLHSM